MNKLILKDGKTIENLTEMNESYFTVAGEVSEVQAIYEQLTEDNLSHILVKDAQDNLLAVWKDKAFTSITYSDGVVMVSLKDVDYTAKQLTELQEASAELYELILGGGL